jgi:hypothetical protein
MRASKEFVAYIRRASRFFFTLLARLWDSLPKVVTRHVSFQIVELMSIRPTKLTAVRDSVVNLTGLFNRGSSIVIYDGKNFVSHRLTSNSLYAGILISTGPNPELVAALNSIRERTVVIGGFDVTFPKQVDKRFEPRTTEEIADLSQALARFDRVYVENLVGSSQNLSPLPGGIIPHPWQGSVVFAQTRPNQKGPKNLVFCAHKTRRSSEQWDTRRRVTEIARGPWSSFTTVQSGRSTLREFRRELQQHPFTLCVEGGGIDPSPKAFEALLQGSIPIIRDSDAADAYRHFPVLVIPEWEPRHLSPEILRQARGDILGSWPDWTDVLKRLSMGYWREMIIRGESTRLNLL